MKDKLIELMNYYSNNANFCKHIRRHSEIYKYIINNTTFLDINANDAERIYCVLNDIVEIQLDAFGEPAVFLQLNKGYRLRVLEKLNYLNKKIKKIKSEKKKLSIKSKIINENLKYAALVNSTDEKRGRKIRLHVSHWISWASKGLYDDRLKEVIDYIICPITKLRKTSIRKNYTENILGLTMEQYLDIVGKDFVLICSGHKKKISTSLKVIDKETGLTKHELATNKTIAILNEVDIVTGLTGYQKLGAATKATHEANIDENGLNGYQQIGIKAIIKGNKTKQANGTILQDDEKSEYKHYKNLIMWLTHKNSDHLDKTLLGLAGTPDAMHIDHMYSIYAGYKNKISPFIIGSKSNLTLLPWKENIQKWTNCSITLEELFTETNYTDEKSLNEFNIIMDIIEKECDNFVSAGLLFEKYNERTKI